MLLIATTAALLLLGLVMVYSASTIIGITSFNDGAYYFKKQLIMVAAGLVVLVVAAVIPYHVWEHKVPAWCVWGVIVFLLILTLVLGNMGLGAKRWLDIAGFNLQPSEFAKIAMMLVVAGLVVHFHNNGSSNLLLGLMAMAIGVPVLLIMGQPDLGTTLVALVGVIAVFWFGEFPRKFILIGVGLLVVVGLLAITFTDFRQDRIDSLLDPWADPLDTGYQIINSFYAFSDGGIFGVGLGMSRQKFLYLPEAQNDFIFAIIGEELGLLGALAVVLLFLAFVIAALQVARNASGLFGRMVAGTAGTLIGFQAFLNMLCVVGWAPITGKPLPFVSAGGTSLIATLILVGLILAVSLRSNAPDPAAQRREQFLIIEGGSSRSAALGTGRSVTQSASRPAAPGTSRSGAPGTSPRTATSRRAPRNVTQGTGRNTAPGTSAPRSNTRPAPRNPSSRDKGGRR
jgi:cell division protein FtsW